jgi:hypothetical protein
MKIVGSIDGGPDGHAMIVALIFLARDLSAKRAVGDYLGRGSIRGRLFSMVNDEDFDRPLCGFQPKAQLLL